MKKYDYLIVGAGLFGAVFAYEAMRHQKTCLVIERRDHVAGNIYTKEVHGIRVHVYGAHIFHTSDRAAWRFIHQFADFNHYINSPVAFYKDETYNLPFNMNTFSRMWGIRTPAEARAKIDEEREAYIRQMKEKRGIPKDQPFEPQNLEEQALSLAGRDVYEKLIKGYTEKQWGRPCTDLPAFIIKRLPFRFTYDNNYFNDPYQGIPIGGYTPIIEKMLAGADVVTGFSYEDLMRDHKLPDGTSVSFARTLFTGQVDAFYQFCYGPLQYRSVRFETEELDTDNYQGNAVINYTDREVPWTRIIEHKHFEFGTQKTTIISREYSQEWKPGMEPYYPVNNEKNNELLKKYQALAGKEKDLVFGGRLGLYKYYDMDKALIEAEKLAEREFGDSSIFPSTRKEEA